MKCARCLERGLVKPRNAITIWWGEALCLKCLDIRLAAARERAS